jgi:cytochrome b561
MILAFLASDLISPLIIRGGGGIAQTLGSTRARPRWYAFLVLFISIPIVGVIIDRVSGLVMTFLVEVVPAVVGSQVSSVQVEIAEVITDLVVGLVLAYLVYIDLQVRFFAR